MAKPNAEKADGLDKYKAQRARAFRRQLISELITSVLPVFIGAVWSETMMGAFEMIFKGDGLNDAKISVRAIMLRHRCLDYRNDAASLRTGYFYVHNAVAPGCSVCNLSVTGPRLRGFCTRRAH